MAKQTFAQKHTTAHKKRRDARLTNRPLPYIPGYVGHGIQVAADAEGQLYRIDAESGTISKLRWER